MARDLDHFGSSDAWLMFALWMWASGHPLIAAFSATICVLICVLPDPKQKADVSAPSSSRGGEA